MNVCTGDQHGTANAYRNHRCRCPGAAQQVTRHRKRRAAGLVPPGLVSNVGVIRRRQALGAIGYSLADLAPHFGVTAAALNCHVIEDRTVLRSTYEQWCRVYDLLSMTPGTNTRARREGRRRRWAPPLAWDDDSIDDPASKPDFGLRRARCRQDIAEDAHFLSSMGLTSHGIAARLGVSEPYVRGLLNSQQVAA
jgi:hypothetical protein